ncbi:hypothetical protein Trydic_g2396 [Trypoxylus dichotomus]
MNGVRRLVTSCENVERVRALILESSQRSTHKHALAPGLSDHHSDLHYHPYKLPIVHELSDVNVTSIAGETHAGRFSKTGAIVFFSEVHFHYTGYVSK